MECHHLEFPISILKVDFGCFKHCPMDVKKILQPLKGVKSISIDPSEGMVIVFGDANPMKLVKLLQKMGKKAQLWSYERAPSMEGKSSSHCCCESYDSKEDNWCDHDSDEEQKSMISWENLKLKTLYAQKSKKTKHGWKDWFGFGNKTKKPNKSLSSSLPSLSPSLLPPLIPGHYLPVSWNQPVTNAVPLYSYYGRNPTALATYRQLRSRLLSTYNPMINYTSYADNYRFTV